MFCSCANYFVDGNFGNLSLYYIRMGSETVNDYLRKSISSFLAQCNNFHNSSRRKLKESTQASFLTEMKIYNKFERKKKLSEG